MLKKSEQEKKEELLDEILAEFGSNPAPKKVVPFPTKPPLDEAEDDDEDDEQASLLGAIFAPPEAVEVEEDNTIPLPVEAPQGGILGKLKQSMNRRADQMYEQSDSIDDDEVRRREQYIPGTDEEEEEEPSPIHRPKKVAPPPPDTPPKELAARYHRGLFSLRIRSFLVFLLMVVAFVPLVLPLTNRVLPPAITADPRYLYWCYAGGLGLGALLAIDVLAVGLWRGVRGKLGMDTLLALSIVASAADCLYLADHPNLHRPIPYCAINLLALWLALHGAFEKRLANQISCRTAAGARTPYLVTRDEKKWNARDTYCKWTGAPEGFGSQMQMDDGAQRMFRLFAPIFLLTVVISVMYRDGDVGNSLWTAAAMLTACTALGAPLCYGRASLKMERRLSESGATLAGWAGVAASGREARVLVTDSDLFPVGALAMKAPTYFQGYPEATVISYTAALLTAADCDLTPLFEHYLRSHNAKPRLVKNPQFHEAGGISARIGYEDVLVGSANFMNLMGVALPTGGFVPNMVFCAIDNHLAGMFPVQYALHPSIAPAIYTLLSEGVAPVLATRDFNLYPATLSGRFRLPADRMDFPMVARRRELSDPGGVHNQILTAVVTREGLLPFSEAIVGAKRLRLVTRSGSLFCAVGGGLGLALTAYLTSVGAYTSADPIKLLAFLLLWLAPVWLVTEWGHRF